MQFAYPFERSAFSEAPSQVAFKFQYWLIAMPTGTEISINLWKVYFVNISFFLLNIFLSTFLQYFLIYYDFLIIVHQFVNIYLLISVRLCSLWIPYWRLQIRYWCVCMCCPNGSEWAIWLHDMLGRMHRHSKFPVLSFIISHVWLFVGKCFICNQGRIQDFRRRGRQYTNSSNFHKKTA